MNAVWHKLSILNANSNFFIALKAFVAAVTLLIPCYYLDLSSVSVTAVLGIVAAVISEGNDNVKQRIINSIITLCCFTASSGLISLVYPYKWLFLASLCAFTFAIIILGSLGQRYVSISFATLIIAVYTMLGLSHGAEVNHDILEVSHYSQLLLAGAAWYFVISIVLLKFTLYNTTREKLASIYFTISEYQKEKTKFFSCSKHDHKIIRHTLSTLNINIVNAMGECRNTLDLHAFETTKSAELRHLIHLYQEAQELHEKITSSHFHYQSLQRGLDNSLILNGFEQVLKQLSVSCHERGKAILYKTSYQHDHGVTWSLSILERELEQLQLDWNVHAPLKLLFSNLYKANTLLIHSEDEDERPFLTLAPRASVPILTRFSQSLQLSSPVFRHAIRLTLGMAISYLIIQQSDYHGYWVVLTTLFVLQPSYSATKVKLNQRISGTLIGIIVGSALLYLFPTERSQLFWLAMSAFLFFYYLRQDYSKAVTYITLLVLLAFNLLYLQGYEVALPRIIDTLTGCGIAILLSKLVLPNWQYKQFPSYLVNAITANSNYFNEILEQYATGKNNDLPYRISRRAAYVADSQLVASWRDMQIEPSNKRDKLNHVYDIARRNHAMLSSLSALGVHRKQIENQELTADLKEVKALIGRALEQAQETIKSGIQSRHFYTDDIQCLLVKYADSQNKKTVLLLIQKLQQITAISEELQIMANEIKNKQ